MSRLLALALTAVSALAFSVVAEPSAEAQDAPVTTTVGTTVQFMPGGGNWCC